MAYKSIYNNCVNSIVNAFSDVLFIYPCYYYEIQIAYICYANVYFLLGSQLLSNECKINGMSCSGIKI